MKTNFILGAGFSKPAGYPLGKELNEKFANGVEDKLLCLADMQWFWDEHDPAMSRDGRSNGEYLKYSFLLSELIERYQIIFSTIFDYELFYSWLLNIGDDYLLVEFNAAVNRANNRLRTIGSQQIFKHGDRDIYIKTKDMFNYLIADTLNRKYNRSTSISEYQNFLNQIHLSDNCNIFSLNHDKLVEFLLKEKNIKYSDGFSEINSDLIGCDNIPLEIFQNTYDQPCKLFKLHGSIDYHKFSFERQIIPGTHIPQQGNLFFKPKHYRDRLHAKRIDKITRTIIQDHSFEAFNPQFITGITKKSIIEKEYIYGTLYNYYQVSFQDIDQLVIIGYSYRDEHINKIIKEKLEEFDFKVININCGMKFPFRRRYSKNNIIDLCSISEL